MESIHDSSETSFQRRSKKFTLFQDLLPEDSCPSDCESGISDHRSSDSTTSGMVRINNGETIHHTITSKLVSNLTSYGFADARVESVHRKDYSGIMSRAKFQSFCIYLKAMEMKCNGNANVKYGWYGAASRNEVAGILAHGFGHAANFAPADHPVECLQPEEEGLRYMLLCRVILGKTEVVRTGQDNPSSEEYDCGVDSLSCPRKYVVWSSRVNTHVLPEFLVCFRASASSCRGHRPHHHQPNSHWMPFATLISALAKFLPPDAVALIAKYHTDYKKKKLARYEMIQKVRLIAGDKLLMSIIKSYQRK